MPRQEARQSIRATALQSLRAGCASEVAGRRAKRDRRKGRRAREKGLRIEGTPEWANVPQGPPPKRWRRWAGFLDEAQGGFF